MALRIIVRFKGIKFVSAMKNPGNSDNFALRAFDKGLAESQQ